MSHWKGVATLPDTILSVRMRSIKTRLMPYKRSDEEYQNTINAIKEWERQEKENKDNAKASRQLLQETREELAKERAKAAQGSK